MEPGRDASAPDGDVAAVSPPAFAPSACGLVIGATKCATTSLFRALSFHPRICGSRRKELDIFLDAETAPTALEDYLGWFDANPSVHAATLEASPQYTHHPRLPGVAGRIAAIPAPWRLIYLVRNPFDRLESHYRDGLAEGFLTAPAHEALDELGALASDYMLQLDRYLEHFAAEQILVLTMEQLAAAPALAHARVCRHLGLAPMRLPAAHHNRGEDHVAARAGRLAGEEGDAPVWEARRRARADARLTPAQREHLHRQWAPGMARLSAEFGVDVAAWGFRPARRPAGPASVAVPAAPAAPPVPPPSGRPVLPEHMRARLGQPFAPRDGPPEPGFAVIVATYGRARSLARLLARLETVREHSPRMTVHVVNDGDPDPEYDAVVAGAGEGVCYLRLPDNRGPAAARNWAAQTSAAEFLVFIDDDCFPDPAWLERLAARLKAFPELAAVGGSTRPLSSSGRRRLVERFTIARGLNPKPGVVQGRLACLPSCNLAVRRDWFLAVGGFDPEMRASEDFNLTYRLKAAGAHVFADPAWSAPHDQDWRLADLWRRAYRDGYWITQHLQRTGDGLARSILPSEFGDGLFADLRRRIGVARRTAADGGDRLAFAVLEAGCTLAWRAGWRRARRGGPAPGRWS